MKRSTNNNGAANAANKTINLTIKLPAGSNFDLAKAARCFNTNFNGACPDDVIANAGSIVLDDKLLAHIDLDNASNPIGVFRAFYAALEENLDEFARIEYGIGDDDEDDCGPDCYDDEPNQCGQFDCCCGCENCHCHDDEDEEDEEEYVQTFNPDDYVRLEMIMDIPKSVISQPVLRDTFCSAFINSQDKDKQEFVNDFLLVSDHVTNDDFKGVFVYVDMDGLEDQTIPKITNDITNIITLLGTVAVMNNQTPAVTDPVAKDATDIYRVIKGHDKFIKNSIYGILTNDKTKDKQKKFWDNFEKESEKFKDINSLHDLFELCARNSAADQVEIEVGNDDDDNKDTNSVKVQTSHTEDSTEDIISEILKLVDKLIEDESIKVTFDINVTKK